MASIVPPPTGTQLGNTHPDLPPQGDDEDIVAYIGRVSEWLETSPPGAPAGFRLIPCEKSPRHFPLYEVADDVFYETPCPWCVYHATSEDANRLRCQLNHRRWKSWRIWGWLSRKGYALGVIAGSGTSSGRCSFCGIGRQHMRPRWRGKRPYILYVSRETWACLRRGHRRREHIACGLCSICAPCPECGSADPTHYSCESDGVA